MKMLKKLICVMIVMALYISVMPYEAFAANSQLKAFTHMVQSYEAKDRSYTMSRESRFFIVSDGKPSDDLLDTVKLMSQEYAAKKKPSSKALPIVYGSQEQAKDGDIIIMIKDGYSSQKYRLSVGKRVMLKASDTDGIFYGLQTLLQYRLCTKSRHLPGCVIIDYPDVKERVAHLDCGRKYFSRNWIENYIRNLSWQKYNAIEIHFSEDQGLRLESKKYPWLAGTYNNSKGVLSQKDMKHICKVARKYHVEVIPSFDSPGHMNYITKRYMNYVKKHPGYTFKWNGKKYKSKNISNYFKYRGQRTGYNYLGINLANSSARAFTKSLINEYADFFKEQGCTQFNIGGDELLGWNTFTLGGRTFGWGSSWYALEHWDRYAGKKLGIRNGNATDTFISYMNSIAKMLEKKGYKVRMWNDEVLRNSNQHVKLKKSIEIVYWSNKYASIRKLESRGYHMYNAIGTWTYYVTYAEYKNVTGSRIYRKWNPKSFADPGNKTKKIKKSQYEGAYFCIWCDYAAATSLKDIWKDVKPLTWSSSQKMWNKSISSHVSYDRFKSLRGTIGSFPGYAGSCTKKSSLPDAGTVSLAQQDIF